MPLRAAGKDIPSTECYSGLGIPLDREASMGSLLKQVDQRGDLSARTTVAAFDHLGFPLAAMIAAMQGRVLPKAAFGAEFLLVRGDWRKRLDAAQHRWYTQVFHLVFHERDQR